MKVFTGTLLVTFVGFLSFVQLSSQSGRNPPHPPYGMEVGVPRVAEVDGNPFTEVWIRARVNEVKDLPNGATYKAKHSGLLKMTYANKRGPITVEDNEEVYVVWPPQSGRGTVREDSGAASSSRRTHY